MGSRNKKKIGLDVANKKSRNKKKIELGVANKKRRINKKRTSSSTHKKRRSKDVIILFNQELKDMKKLTSNDEAFHLSLTKIREIIGIIRSRKTPARETYMQWDKYTISFYLKMCICFGVDYQHLEATCANDDTENGNKHLTNEMSLKEQHLEATCENDDDENGKKYPTKEMSLKGQEEEPMECSDVKLPVTKRKGRGIPFKEYMMALKELEEEPMECSDVKLPLTKGKGMPFKEHIKKIEHHLKARLGFCRRALKGPFEFGSYSPKTKPDRIPYHLYLLVKKVVDIKKLHNNTCDPMDLKNVEQKIRFFCNYFHSHLPNCWNYNRNNASSLISCYDPTRKPRYLLAGYTPIRVYQKPNYDQETGISLYELAYVMNIIHSRKMPSFWMLPPEMISFYCKLCSCFGIDYSDLECSYEDDVCLMDVRGKPEFQVFHHDISK